MKAGKFPTWCILSSLFYLMTKIGIFQGCQDFFYPAYTETYSLQTMKSLKLKVRSNMPACSAEYLSHNVKFWQWSNSVSHLWTDTVQSVSSSDGLQRTTKCHINMSQCLPVIQDVWSLVVALPISLFFFLRWNLHITIISHVSVLSGYFDYYCSHSNSWAETEKHQHTNLHCDLHSPGGYGGLVAWHLQGKQDCVWVPENNRAPPPVPEDQNHSSRTKDRKMWGLFSDTLPWDLCSC